MSTIYQNKQPALSKLRLTIFLFFMGIISPCSIWANDFAPPCDTIILVSGNIVIANIQTENNAGISYNPCNETVEETLTWNQIKDINRWINPEIAKRKAKKVAIQEAKEEMSQKEKIKEAYTNTKETHAQKLRSTQEEMRRRHKLKQKRQALKKETLKGINWRFSISSGMVNFTQLSTIDIAFARQGFSTNKTGWFTLYNRIPRYDLFTAVHIDRKIVSNLFVGLKTSFLSQYVYAYKESDYRIDSPSHLIQTSIDYWDISSKVEWVSREHSFAFYGGPSLVLITDRRFKSTTSLAGGFVGISYFNFITKKNNPLFTRLYLEFNAQQKYWFKGETQKKLGHTNEIVSNTFNGLHLPFGHLKIGIELGFSLKKRSL